MAWGDDSLYTLPQIGGLEDLLPEPAVPPQPASRYRPEVERLRPLAYANGRPEQEAEDWLAGA